MQSAHVARSANPVFHCFCLVAYALFATVSIAQDRNTLVLNDRSRILDDGYWIYNNLDKGYEEAKRTGKPLLVVLRCIPCKACAQLDEQVIEKNPAVRKHLSNFVCVRVVHANGLDLSRFQFDYDQSWAVFFMNGDGTIYGRYGTRSHEHESADDVSLDGFLDSMQLTLSLHAKYPQVRESLLGKTGPVAQIARPEQFPRLKEKYNSELNYGSEVARSCIHCHQVGEVLRENLWAQKKSLPTEWIYAYPHPKIFGMIMDPAKAVTIKEVAERSLAAESGFQSGDRLVSLQGQPLVSVADVQWILHQQTTNEPLLFKISRNGVEKELRVELPEKWKELGDISWRASTWGFRRMVTGGLTFESLSSQEREALGLDARAAGLRVKHVGQFNAHAAAKRAGFKKDDLIVSIDGIQQPMTESQAIAALLRTKRPGDQVAIELIREGKPLKLELPIQQ
jgi:serine protease Do